ncbi:MAG: hypothetical protein M3Y60_12050 [Bacteroidota bacterium]|nr:hypothetical protein [Bacteroidota bacterium]
MKSKMLFLLVVLLSAVIVSCSDDDEKKGNADPDITHEGDKWTISSIDYMLIDQNFSGSSIKQVVKDGTKTDAGTFYFVEGSSKGSFEINVEGYTKEDSFDYTLDEGNVSIVSIEQQAGVQTNQNIVALSGSRADTEMTLSGSITKQSLSGQFSLTMEVVLKKQQ